MFCKYCGAELDGNERFCPACGKPLERPAAPAATAAAAPPAPEGKKKKTGLIVAVAVAAVAVAAVAAGLFLRSRSGAPSSQKSPDYGQSAETAFDELVCTDQYLFFRDVRQGEDADGEPPGLVCRSDLDGGNVLQLTDGTCEHLYCHEGEIYYVGIANGYSRKHLRTDNRVYTEGLIWLAQDGSSARMIYDEQREAAFEGDQVFFAMPMNTYAIHQASVLDETDHELPRPLLIGNRENQFLDGLVAWDGWVYARMYDIYSNERWLARVNEYDGGVERLADVDARMLQQGDGELFYTVDGDLWRMEPNGADARQVLSVDVAGYEVLDGYIYYREKDRPGLWRVPLDGGARTQITSALCADFCLGNGMVYYADMYDHGSIWAVDLAGTEEPRRLVAADVRGKNAVAHNTAGVDGYEKPGEKYLGTISATDQPVHFDDSEFERFLAVMFNKTPGTVTGADLASVKFFGYYEGAPTEPSELRYVGQYDYLAENCVYFSTEDVPPVEEPLDIMFYEEGGDLTADAYGQRCQKMTVRSNDWLCEHVLPYLCCFPNLQQTVFGYCWVTENMCLPAGLGDDGEALLNTQAKYTDVYDQW